MIVLEGKQVAESILGALKLEADTLRGENKRLPGLAAILIGENSASKVYVNSKIKTCEKLGIVSETFFLDEKVTDDKVFDLIQRLNTDERFDGILLQLPLPKHLNEELLLAAINPAKDVDGFSAVNMGNLLLGRECFVPCTPAGIMEILKFYNINPSGKHTVVIGRSNIVGKPMAALLMQKAEYANATVTVCHSGTKNLSEFTLQADIIIAALGSAHFLKPEMVKSGAVIIDVGINRIDDASAAKGYRIVGDAEYNGLAGKVSAMTPVPGGVGLTTIALLMKNTFKAYKQL